MTRGGEWALKMTDVKTTDMKLQDMKPQDIKQDMKLIQKRLTLEAE